MSLAEAGTVPLTPEQRAILLGSLNEGAASYAVQVRCEVEPFDPAAFQTAWNRMVERHDVLRMKVLWQGYSRPVQAILPEPLTAVRTTAVRGVDRARLRDIATRRFDEELLCEVDLEADRLVTPLAVYADGVAFVSWITHHLVLDGLSSRLLLGEVAEEYDCALAGVQRRAPRPGSFVDYARWRASRATEDAGRSPSGPSGASSGLVNVVTAGPATGSTRVIEQFPEGLTTRMRMFARREGATAATQFHAAWALAEAALTGATEVRLGSVGYGRPPEVAESDSILGMFTVTRPLAVAVDPERALAGSLAEVQRDLVTAWDDRAPSRGSGGLGNASVVVVSHYAPLETFRGHRTGVTMELLDVVDRTPHPIVATVFIGGRGAVVLNVNGRQPSEGAPERLLATVVAFLERIVDTKDTNRTVLGDIVNSPSGNGTRR